MSGTFWTTDAGLTDLFGVRTSRRVDRKFIIRHRNILPTRISHRQVDPTRTRKALGPTGSAVVGKRKNVHVSYSKGIHTFNEELMSLPEEIDEEIKP